MGFELRHKTLWTRLPGFAAMAAGLLTVAALEPLRAAEGSLSDLDIEKSELKLTLDKVMGENTQLRATLSATERSLADTERRLTEMRKSLAAASGEGEIFKRQALELKLRIEALGLDSGSASSSKLEQRLLNAVSDLRGMSDEKKKLSEALVRLSEAASLFAKKSTGASNETRLVLESELRNARIAMGIGSPSAVEATAVPSTITDGITISVKDDLALVVMNVGSKQGVKLGMPFQVIRAGKLIGNVRVVDVREKISGAVVQNIYSERDRIKVGDHLKVDAQQ